MSLGNDYSQQLRRVATYVDKIFKGAKLADLPVELPTKFELVINLKTAKALVPTIPLKILNSEAMNLRRRALVVLPTYNERDNLGPITGDVLAATSEVDVLVVDDNSPDGTGRLGDEISARETRVKVLHRPRKEGLGRAYLAAFAIALSDGYEFVVEMDADFSHDPTYLPEMLARAEDADLVIGSRNVSGGGTRGWSLHRRLLSQSANLYARTILSVGVHDLTSGFKCFRREVLEAIGLPTVASAGYAFQIELTYRAIRRGFRVSEMPIVFVERAGGTRRCRGPSCGRRPRVWVMRASQSIGPTR